MGHIPRSKPSLRMSPPTSELQHMTPSSLRVRVTSTIMVAEDASACEVTGRHSGVRLSLKFLPSLPQSSRNSLSGNKTIAGFHLGRKHHEFLLRPSHPSPQPKIILSSNVRSGPRVISTHSRPRTDAVSTQRLLGFQQAVAAGSINFNLEDALPSTQKAQTATRILGVVKELLVLWDHARSYQA